MQRNPITFVLILIWAAASILTSGLQANAQSAADWMIGVTPNGSGAVLGSVIGIDHRATDGYDSGNGIPPSSSNPGILLMCYRQQGTAWTGPTGLYGGDIEYTPIPAGGSKTWSDFYLWAQNFTPSSANVVRLYSGSGCLPPPAGYRGHLVLDYVPTSCNWTGPMDYWLDLTVRTELAMPIPIVTDPLDGTRFHLTVHAPVPEPSCLAALGMGITAIGGLAIRRRRA